MVYYDFGNVNFFSCQCRYIHEMITMMQNYIVYAFNRSQMYQQNRVYLLPTMWIVVCKHNRFFPKNFGNLVIFLCVLTKRKIHRTNTKLSPTITTDILAIRCDFVFLDLTSSSSSPRVAYFICLFVCCVRVEDCRCYYCYCRCLFSSRWKMYVVLICDTAQKDRRNFNSTVDVT